MPQLQDRIQSAQQVDALREALLGLHQAVIEYERRVYEKAQGRQSGAEFLQVLAYDAAFEWLAPLGKLIVALDSGLEDGEPAIARTIADQARALLRRDADSAHPFSLHYAPMIDASPDVALAHGRLLAALRGVATE